MAEEILDAKMFKHFHQYLDSLPHDNKLLAYRAFYNPHRDADVDEKMMVLAGHLASIAMKGME